MKWGMQACVMSDEENEVVEGEGEDEEEAPRPRGKQYITRLGAERLHKELLRLLNEERPKVTAEVSAAAAQGDRSENAEYIYGKKRLREIDRRIRFLQRRLDVCTVVDPRDVLAEFGVTIPNDVTVRVHDSTADLRYIVLPMRPNGTKGWSEEKLAALVTRDCMIGTALPRARTGTIA